MMETSSLISLIKSIQGSLTQNDFAQKCGISSSNLTRIYKGAQKPSPNLLKKIADTSNNPTIYHQLMKCAGYLDLPDSLVDEGLAQGIDEEINAMFKSLDTFFGPMAIEMLLKFNSLNFMGRTEALKRVSEMASLDEYLSELTEGAEDDLERYKNEIRKTPPKRS